MTTSWVYHPNSNRCASSGIPSPQCSHVLCCRVITELLHHSCASSLVGCTSFLSCCAFCGLATCAVSSSSTLLNFLSSFPFFHSGHSLYLCLFSLHLKHSTTIISCLLIILSSTPHCITLLFNTLNLFWGTMVPFSPSLLFLQLQTRCPNPLQYLHIFPFLSSSSVLSLARACFFLSKLLMRFLY